jgi:hypothetical protein
MSLLEKKNTPELHFKISTNRPITVCCAILKGKQGFEPKREWS